MIRPFWTNHHLTRVRGASQRVNRDDESAAPQKGLSPNREDFLVKFDVFIGVFALIDDA